MGQIIQVGGHTIQVSGADYTSGWAYYRVGVARIAQLKNVVAGGLRGGHLGFAAGVGH